MKMFGERRSKEYMLLSSPLVTPRQKIVKKNLTLFEFILLRIVSQN